MMKNFTTVAVVRFNDVDADRFYALVDAGRRAYNELDTDDPVEFMDEIAPSCALLNAVALRDEAPTRETVLEVAYALNYLGWTQRAQAVIGLAEQATTRYETIADDDALPF